MSAPTGVFRWWRAQGPINGATAVTLRAPHNSTSTVYVTRFSVSITAHANGKLVQLQDSAANVYAKRTDLTAAAAVPDFVEWNWETATEADSFGGIAMAVGATAQAVSEASGPSGYFWAAGYEIVPNP
jgi:hypothetical protein